MARARPGLAKVVQEILLSRGSDGRRLSLRQAERLTGLSPATIGELTKGNARTEETLRRFAEGMGVEADRLLLLAGFAPDTISHAVVGVPAEPKSEASEAEVSVWLDRWSKALANLPPCRERDLFLERLKQDAELLERWGERLNRAEPEALKRE